MKTLDYEREYWILRGRLEVYEAALAVRWERPRIVVTPDRETPAPQAGTVHRPISARPL